MQQASAKQFARAVKAVPIRVLTVSKGDSAGAAAVAEEWRAKCARFTSVTLSISRPNPGRYCLWPARWYITAHKR